MSLTETNTSHRQSNSGRSSTTVAHEVYDCENEKRWSGPFSKVETANEIIRNLGPIYPGREFCVNTVRVQRI